MAGTNPDPFLEHVAKCTFCLDFKASYLRRQWRKFGRLGPVEVPFGFTLAKLGDNLAKTSCMRCGLLVDATEHISREFDISFRNASFEFVNGGGLHAFSLGVNSLHPSHVDDSVLARAQANPDLETDLITWPARGDSTPKTEYRISSPDYEIFYVSEQSPDKELAPGWADLPTSPSRCGDTGSEAAVDWAKAQIEKCRAEHPLCNTGESYGKLPTRVLDLGDDLSCITADAKLFETSGEDAAYVCLSHCWGGKVPIITTTETLAAFKMRIPWEQLPKTFQDAAIFTRRLGIRYLWIDSFCIIQDDADDWSTESGRMASIYEHAELTLAATASANGRGGLFRKDVSEVRLSPPDDIRMRRLPDPMFFETTDGGENLPDPKFFGTTDERKNLPDRRSPLLKRAWVLQERMLSRRVLHFTPLELVLECRVGKATESGHDWIDASMKHKFSAAYLTETMNHEFRSDMWRSLVKLFTQLGITKVGDTLAAMAGLAKRMRLPGEMEGDYLAGLWRHDLLSGLLWVRSGHGPYNINCNVPTWSWARTDAPKKFMGSSSAIPLCHVVDAKCTPSREMKDLFLGVNGGYISVSGFLLPARVDRDGRVTVDGIPRVQHHIKKDYDWTAPEYPDTEDAIREGERLFLLPIVAGINDDLEVEVIALVLSAHGQNNDRKAHRRVGITRGLRMLFLQCYHHILAGNDLRISCLKKQIAFGESLVENGRYRDRSEPPLSDGIMVPFITRFKYAAEFEWACRYGDSKSPEVSAIDFAGSPHLEVLKEQLRLEEERVAEWTRRNNAGDEQVHKEEIIKIV